ncbi:MAG: Do family serine endopeptidase [Acidobacteriota bacterium]|jgi:Do/DeqQ family serine protease
MSSHRRQAVSFALILGAVAFGLVLAGGLDLTVPTSAQDSEPIVPRGVVGPEGGGLPSFANLTEAVEPAVASVQTATIRERPEGMDPFRFFFGPRDRRERPPGDGPERFRSEGGGSGFVISADGLVVTNFHVVQDADEVEVRLQGREYEAEIVGTDPPTDLALLQVDVGHELPYLALGDSDALRPGDWVMAIGDPLGLARTVTVGVVSAKGRQINIGDESSFENFIQTDAAINFGNSGGPLINVHGEVIGINSAINWGAENIGFAVPVNTLKQILPQLRETGRVSRGYLGIQINDVNYDIAQAFGLEEPQGVLISQVLPGQPAGAAGLRHGDIILEIDGHPVEDSRYLIDYVSAQGPGGSVEVTVLRDGERISRTVELTERPSRGVSAQAEPSGEEGGIEWLGIRYQDLTPGSRQTHGIPGDVEGVWITSVDAASPLWEEGVRNDGVLYVVTEVNGRPVESVEEFEAAVRNVAPGSRLRLYLRRFQQGEELAPRFVFPEVPE